MPKFAANLTMLLTEGPFLELFALADMVAAVQMARDREPSTIKEATSKRSTTEVGFRK